MAEIEGVAGYHSLEWEWEDKSSVIRGAASSGGPIRTWVRPSKAARALAARLVTMSPRSPSTSSSLQISEILMRSS